MRIQYPESWPQRDRETLDNMFHDAYKYCKWFFHGGLSGPLWFSPAELQKEQENGKFVWGAVNWQLRDPNERLDAIGREHQRLNEEYKAMAQRMMGASLAGK